jgi:hypothetical protein
MAARGLPVSLPNGSREYGHQECELVNEIKHKAAKKQRERAAKANLSLFNMRGNVKSFTELKREFFY